MNKTDKQGFYMHEHHRDRLREKALKDVSLLNDYELLELILFGVVPRRNTNDIAHRLIDEFGSLKAVFTASPKLLENVKGVGRITAAHISAMGSVIERIGETEDRFPEFFSFETIKQPLIDYYKPYREEVFMVFFLDKKQKITSRRTFYGHNMSEVVIDLNELSRQIVLNKPDFIVICHNHLSGNTAPSRADDVATQKICLISSLNGSALLDHIIVSKENVFSYYYEKRLDEIRRKVSETLR